MKQFWLKRVIDVTGTSGTGIVAEGVVFSNGFCAIHWLSQYMTVAIYESVEDLEKVHGHNGSTLVIWQLPADCGD